MKDELIFEILNAPQHIKIYRSGKVEGVNKGAIIANWLYCHDIRSQLLSSPENNESTSVSSGLSQEDGS